MVITRKIIWSAGIVCAGLALAMGSGAADEGQGSQEINTAVQYAYRASQSRDIFSARTDLHAVINCLVGPKGRSFDAHSDVACDARGNGALRDIADPSLQQQLREALGEAKYGLQENGLSSVRMDAISAMVFLKSVH